MLCRQCDLPLAAGQQVCPRCGTPVDKPRVWDWIFDKLKGWLCRHASVRIVKNGKLTIVSPMGESKVYTSLEDLPHEIREAVEARIPDALVTSDVQKFNSLDEAPPEIRAKIEEAMRGHGNHVEFVDHDSGQQHVYDSLEDIPPDIRSRIEQARQEAGFENEDNTKFLTSVGSVNTSFTIRHDR